MSPHNVVIEDATVFVEKSKAAGGEHREYDYIIHDVFTGGAEPIGLFTQEFLQGLSEMLTVDGVIAIVSAFTCQSGWQTPDNVRITPGTFFFRPPATLSAPSSPFSQHVDFTERMQIPRALMVGTQRRISPTWSSFVGSRVTASLSESQ